MSYAIKGRHDNHTSMRIAYNMIVFGVIIPAVYVMEIILLDIDSGKQYNPLAKPDPDVTLAANDRKKGGLGIFMVKNSMDDVKYEYKDGQNILTIIKKL